MGLKSTKGCWEGKTQQCRGTGSVEGGFNFKANDSHMPYFEGEVFLTSEEEWRC